MTVEDRLRATTEAVTASMRPVRPLDLSPAAPDAAPAGRRHRDASRRLQGARRHFSARGVVGRHRAGWLVPLAAAAVVVVLAATLVAVKTLAGSLGQQQSPPGPATSGPAAATPPPGLPEYYAAVVNINGQRQDLEVGETATGKALFTVRLPLDGAPGDQNASFGLVSAAADDRTFIISIRSYNATSPKTPSVIGWDWLRIDPDGKSGQLYRLAIPALPAGELLAGSVLSPDGKKLAVISYEPTLDTALGQPVHLRVYSVATGHGPDNGRLLRVYTATGEASWLYGILVSGAANTTATWLADGSGIAFDWISPSGQEPEPASLTQQVRRVDLATPSGDLVAGSTLVTSVTSTNSAAETCGQLYPTADGQGAVCGLQTNPDVTSVIDGATWHCQAMPAPLTYRYYSGTSGAYRVLATRPFRGALPGHCQRGDTLVYWASPSAATVIGVTDMTYQSASGDTERTATTPGFLSLNRWAPLPGAVLDPARGDPSSYAVAF